MSKSVEVVRILLASPSDLETERDLVDQVVEQVNREVGSQHGIRLEILRWERDVRPGLGPDPQAVVNEQLGDDYGLFIGMLWTRFGTETPRADSGTEEEFNRTISRYSQNPDSVDVFFYFKDSSPKSLEEIDTDQLSLVRAFRTRIRDCAIYGTFSTDKQLEDKLRADLIKFVFEKSKKATHHEEQRLPKAGSVLTEDDDAVDDDEEGLIDLIEMYQERLQIASKSMNDMADETVAVSRHIEEATPRLQEANKRGDAKVMKRIVNHVADRLEFYATKIDGFLPTYRESFAKAMELLERTAMVVGDFGEGAYARLSDCRESLKTMRANLEHTSDNVGDFRQVVKDLPRFTTKLTKARRRVVDSLGRVHAELKHSNDMTGKASDLIAALAGE